MKNLMLALAGLAMISTGDVHAEDQHRVAFVTSVSGSGQLSTWPDAGNASGLAAGDAICQARAGAAGWANPQNFIAWLSDEDNDAYCRLHGLPGKKADNCGEAELPVAAGPWVRTDGFPFAPGVAELTASTPKVFTPLRIDEFGAELFLGSVFTGTTPAGIATSTLCDNWSTGDSGASATSTRVTEIGRRWTSLNVMLCNSQSRLICLEKLPGPDLPPFETEQRRIAFVSSATGTGALSTWPQAAPGTSGIEAGDSICQSLAADAGLAEPDKFKAWLSDSNTNAVDRFINDGSWVRTDGVPIAANLADLTNGALFTGLGVTELGAYITGVVPSDMVQTGTDANGLATTADCLGWTSASDQELKARGTSVSSGSGWTNTGTAPTACDRTKRLYCFSDAVEPRIFGDRFE